VIRASAPVVLAVLKKLDLISDENIEALKSYFRPEIDNCVAVKVGEIVPQI